MYVRIVVKRRSGADGSVFDDGQSATPYFSG
jgi:hypothetical protein